MFFCQTKKEPFQIEAGATDAESSRRIKAELDQKLEQNKQARQAARANRMIVQGEEEKLPEEDYNLIDEYFNSKHGEMLSKVTGWAEALRGASQDDITVYFDTIYEDQVALREQLTNYQYAIPTGMFSKYQATLRQFQDTFSTKKEEAKPKKKFAFVRKARKAPAAAPEQQPAAAQQTAAAEAISAADATAACLESGNHLAIKDITGDANVLRTASEYEGKENVIVENLVDCTVFLPFSIKCIYIKNIRNTNIYVGSVSGASFVNEATDCLIHLQSHQIRIHNSQRVTFYLTARSSPIIEHCSEMKFGPYIDPESGEPALTFAGWSEQAEQVGLKLETPANLFAKVLDFDWLKQDHSPNWSALESSTPEKKSI